MTLLIYCFLQTFGLFAMFGQRTRLVGFYSWASVGAVLVVLVAETIRIILHFTLKVSLIVAYDCDVDSP